MSAPVYIGVDPAFRQGGFWACILDMADKSVVFKCFEDVLHWHDWLRSPDAPGSCFVCVENSNLQNQTFDMSGSREKVARGSRNVGTNQAVSELAYRSAVRRYGKGKVWQVSPKEKGRKWTPDQFGYIAQSDGVVLPKGPVNQDCRDAYQLASIGRKKAIMCGAKF
jgi:hypothetical protein